MTSLSCRFCLGVGLSLVTGLAQAQSAAIDPLAPLPERQARVQANSPQLPPRIAPAGLRDRIEALGRRFDGKAGISIYSLREGWQGIAGGPVPAGEVSPVVMAGASQPGHGMAAR